MSLWTGWQSKPPQGTPLDPANGLRQGLGVCFAFNEGSGPPIELVSQSAIPTTGTLTWGSSPYGPELQSDGSSGYATATYPAINSYTAFSVGMIWSAAAGDQAFARIVEKGANSDWSFCLNNTGSIDNKVYFNCANGTDVATSSAAICDGNWHWLHGTFDATNGTLYVDGINNGSGTDVTAHSGVDALNIFRYGGGGLESKSKLAGLWIWQNRVLSPSDIQGHIANPWQMFASPIPWWLEKATAGGATRGLFFPASLSLGDGGSFFQSGVNS